MRSGSPIESLAAALHHALLVGLWPVKYPEVEWTDKPDPATGSRRRETGKTLERRPRQDEVDVIMFQQTWGSTALGFGGIGGQAITSAYTVVVEGLQGDACVYFAGRLAYHIEGPGPKFWEDVAARSMHQVAGAKPRYERQRRDANQGGV